MVIAGVLIFFTKTNDLIHASDYSLFLSLFI